MSVGEVETDASCYVDIAADLGGDEALAFVQIAANMYQGWAAKHGYVSHVVAREPSGVAEGYHQRMRLRIDGADASLLGELENGIHGIVRFVEATGRRHMAFIGVRVSDQPDLPWPDERGGWGEQIRSYVMDPESVVLDRRKGTRCSKASEVLAGDLELIWNATT